MPSLTRFCLASRVGSGGFLYDSARAQSDDLLLMDPLQMSSGPFIDRLLAFYARHDPFAARPLPRWALYDCGELPGAVIGLCETCDSGPRPVSMGVFIPMLQPGAWHVFALACETPELIERTIGLGIELLDPCALTRVIYAGDSRPRLTDCPLGSAPA